MADLEKFKDWLDLNTSYTKKTKSNICSRLKRADAIIPLESDIIYLFNLSQSETFSSLSISVKSQIKKAITLYFQFKQVKGVYKNV